MRVFFYSRELSFWVSFFFSFFPFSAPHPSSLVVCALISCSFCLDYYYYLLLYPLSHYSRQRSSLSHSLVLLPITFLYLFGAPSSNSFSKAKIFPLSDIQFPFFFFYSFVFISLSIGFFFPEGTGKGSNGTNTGRVGRVGWGLGLKVDGLRMDGLSFFHLFTKMFDGI